MVRFLVAYGTRPEALKLLPVMDALTQLGHPPELYYSGQSPDLVDRESDIRACWGTPAEGISCILHTFQPDCDCLIVQGDTATAFACALAAYLKGVDVAHVEAGMRTYSDEPYPEEAFRRAIAGFARWHFAPSDTERRNLEREQCTDIYVTGNTIVDTMPVDPFRILVTMHRRENWGMRMDRAFRALWELPQPLLVYTIRHPNWKHATDVVPPNVLDPTDHDGLVNLLCVSDLVVTDSGGLQEEAAHMGVPCIVYRTATERTNLLNVGAVRLCHPDTGDLKAMILAEYAKRRQYGDGTASVKIAEILVEKYT